MPQQSLPMHPIENMWSFPKICLVLALMKGCSAAPAVPDETDPELIGGYFEGDMILNEGRNGLIDETFRWPNGIVYYYINSDFGEFYFQVHELYCNLYSLFQIRNNVMPFFAAFRLWRRIPVSSSRRPPLISLTM